jgi:hypothetical protein
MLLIASESAHSEVIHCVRSRERDPAAFASRARRENLFVELSLRAMLAAPSLSRLEPQGMVRPPGRNVAKSTRHRLRTELVECSPQLSLLKVFVLNR